MFILAIPVMQYLLRRIRGFTTACTIPLERIESIALGSTQIRWYFKTRKRVPVCILRYSVDETVRKRRILFAPRYEPEHVRKAIQLFGDVGIPIETDDDLRELVDVDIRRTQETTLSAFEYEE